jgi:penicillin-binding protein 2
MLGRDEKIPQTKFTAVQYFILAVFIVLAYGLWSLQIRKNDVYAVRSEQNRIKEVPILAPRGRIYDRYGELIVNNYPSFSALLLRDQVRDLNADAQKIADGLHLPVQDVLDRIRRSRLAGKATYEPVIIKDDITPDEQAFIESHRDEFPELEMLMIHRRLYPKDGFMAHTIGYVGEVSEDMLNSERFDLYQKGDIVGQSGLELQYNDILMGKDGSRRVLVNSKGKEVGRPADPNIPALPGQKLRLTIDLDIQKAAELALEGKNGAIVAMDPRNGEILAMVSRPTFDPNDFAVRISAKEWNQLINDPDHPLLNKAIQAQVAPGSVFKVIMSVAGLQEGVAQNLRVNCAGGGVFFGSYHECWVKHDVQRAHGPVDISKGIYQSCDVFFYTLAERLGIERIAKWGTAVGIGKKTGIDLPNEVTGIMPSEEWKMKTFRQKWYAGEVISVGIGQGALAVSPIQIARAIGGIAMGGVFYKPHLVNPEQLPPQFKEAAIKSGQDDVVRVPLDPQNWITVTDAMAHVLNPGGTGVASHIQGVDFAGKTGSTQRVSHHYLETHGLKEKNLKGDLKGNGWFAGVTPRRNPEIVVVVYFEGGEHGPLAARIASQVIKVFVDKQRRVRNNPLLFSDKVDPGSVPIAGVWNNPLGGDGNEADSAEAEDHIQGGTFLLKMERRRSGPSAVKGATALAIGRTGAD